mmetsp:Transcript_2231/g.4326  ORF Transcript_2231/g.4326 Transcript_2231/m.4326 type:complete len:242 (-) Transcript_2231:1038-1763(-)
MLFGLRKDTILCFQCLHLRFELVHSTAMLLLHFINLVHKRLFNTLRLFAEFTMNAPFALQLGLKLLLNRIDTMLDIRQFPRFWLLLLLLLYIGTILMQYLPQTLVLHLLLFLHLFAHRSLRIIAELQSRLLSLPFLAMFVLQSRQTRFKLIALLLELRVALNQAGRQRLTLRTHRLQFLAHCNLVIRTRPLQLFIAIFLLDQHAPITLFHVLQIAFMIACQFLQERVNLRLVHRRNLVRVQ